MTNLGELWRLLLSVTTRKWRTVVDAEVSRGVSVEVVLVRGWGLIVFPEISGSRAIVESVHNCRLFVLGILLDLDRRCWGGF